jgi:hypothetical protein
MKIAKLYTENREYILSAGFEPWYSTEIEEDGTPLLSGYLKNIRPMYSTASVQELMFLDLRKHILRVFKRPLLIGTIGILDKPEKHRHLYFYAYYNQALQYSIEEFHRENYIWITYGYEMGNDLKKRGKAASLNKPGRAPD